MGLEIRDTSVPTEDRGNEENPNLSFSGSQLCPVLGPTGGNDQVADFVGLTAGERAFGGAQRNREQEAFSVGAEAFHVQVSGGSVPRTEAAGGIA